MNIKKKIKIDIIFILIIYFFAIIYNIFDRDNRITSNQLKVLYNAQIDSCKIINIIYRPYPPGRGQYRLFMTDCSADYYPILIRRNDTINYNSLFQIGTIVNKNKYSTKVTIGNKKRIKLIEFYSPRADRLKNILPVCIIASVFLVAAIMLTIFITREYYR